MSRVFKGVVPGLIATVAIAAGCGDNRTESELIADANQKIEQASYRSAIIDLRNALRSNPDSLDARLSLARALTETGDMAAAEKEIDRAIALGATPDQYMRMLGQALRARNAHADLISEIDPARVTDAALASELEAMRAGAMLALGSVDEAEAIFKDVLAAGESVEAQRIALLGIARMAYDRDDIETAERYVRQSFELAPDSAESLLRLGELLMSQEKYAETNDLLSEEAVAGIRLTNIDRFSMLRYRAAAQIGLGDLDAAASTAGAMAALAPEHPISTFMQGQIELTRGNLDVALEHLQALNAKAPNFAPGLTLLGAVSLRKGELVEAEEYLSKALALNPRDAKARNLLAEIKIRSSRPEDAAAMLRRGAAEDSDNPQVLAMLGRAAVQAGDTDTGVDYYRQSIEKDPDNVQLKLALAGALIRLDTQAGRDEATALIRGLPNGAIPENRKSALLVVAQFDKEDPGPARARLQELLAASPDDASLQALAGNFYLSTGELAQARASFDRALALTPNDLGLVFSVLSIDEQEKDFTRSKSLFEAARARNPRDLAPILALAQIAGFEGDSARSVELAREAHAIDETSLPANLLLVSAALGDGDLDEAENYARTALSANPGAARAHGALGLVQAQRGLLREAAINLRRATELAPDDFFLRYELAKVEIAQGEFEQARDSYAIAYELNGDSFDALRALALLEARLGNQDKAVALLDAAKDKFGAGPTLDTLTGEIRAAQRRWPEALAAFSAAYDAAPRWELALMIYRTRSEMGAENAVASVTDWIERQPKHIPSRLTLAQHFQRTGQRERAVEAYEDLLELTPESPLVLNNLAWLYFEEGGDAKTARAIELARRAHLLAPQNFNVADTYGWIQFKSGQREAGVETLRKALANTTPKRSPEIAYHLAVALKARGADNEARETLLQALASSAPFPSRAEATQLLDSM